MSGPSWLSKMTEQARAAQDESTVNGIRRRLGLVITEVADEDIEIRREAGAWRFAWRGRTDSTFEFNDDDMPATIVDQWAFPCAVGADFARNSVLYLYKGRFIEAALGSDVPLSDSLPEVSEVIKESEELAVPVHEEQFDSLLDALPASRTKDEALARRAVRKRADAFAAAEAEKDARFAGTQFSALPIPDGYVSIARSDADELELAVYLSDGDGVVKHAHLIGLLDPDVLVHKLHWQRIRPVSFGTVGSSLSSFVALFRGHWILITCEPGIVPAHLDVPLTELPEELMGERAEFASSLGSWLADRLADDERFTEEVIRPEFQDLLLELPDEEESRRIVEEEVGAYPGASRRRSGIPERVRHEVWRRDEGRCVQCGSQERLEFDHIIPWSKGGSDTARNLQLLCESCNRRKSASI